MKVIGFWCAFGALLWCAFGEDREHDWPFQLGAIIVGAILYGVGHAAGERDEDE